MQPPGGPPQVSRAPETRQLDAVRTEILRRFRVVPVRDGIVLIPRSRMRGVESIEITDSAVAIDGAIVTGAELRDRIGRAADAVLALSYLDRDARRALFQPPVPAAKPPAGATTPPEPTAPSPPDVTPTPQEPALPPFASEPIEREWRSDAKVRIGGDLRVDERERVSGVVVAVGGSVAVDGEVSDNVVAVGGDVRLGPRAVVHGDVTAVGGMISREPGSRLLGSAHEVSIGLPHGIHIRPIGDWRIHGPFWRGPFGGAFGLGLTGFRMAFIGILAFLALLLVRVPVERIGAEAAAEPWKSGAVGLLAQLLFLPLFVLLIGVLIVSIVGIPLLLIVPPLLVLGLLVAWLLGFTGVACGVGAWASEHLGAGRSGPYLVLLTGLIVIWLLTLLGRLAGLAGWNAWAIAAFFLFVGFLVEYVAWTVGLGAAILTRLGRRPAAPPPSAAYEPAGQ
jgi:hypothetical protein